MRASLGTDENGTGLIFSTEGGVHASIGISPEGLPVIGVMVHGATLPAAGADLPRRAAELVAAQFDTVAAVAEGCDALAASGVMPAGVCR